MPVISFEVKLGQEVWFLSGVLYQDSGTCKVTSLGTRWALLDNGYRFDRFTGEVDGRGYVSPGRVYSSEEEWRRESALLETWQRFKAELNGVCPLRDQISRRDILRVRRILGLD